MPDRRALTSACVIGKDWGQLGCAGYMRRSPDTKPATALMFRFSREQRRALKKLAGTPRGLSEHLLIAHGFSVKLLCGLVHAQLAAVVTEPMAARRGVTTLVERIRITDAGRRALEEVSPNRNRKA
jgi:hypothetical protein